MSRKKAGREETRNKGGVAQGYTIITAAGGVGKTAREGERRAVGEASSSRVVHNGGGSSSAGVGGGAGGSKNGISSVPGSSRKRVRVVDEKLGEFSVILQPYDGGERRGRRWSKRIAGRRLSVWPAPQTSSFLCSSLAQGIACLGPWGGFFEVIVLHLLVPANATIGPLTVRGLHLRVRHRNNDHQFR